MFNVFNRKPLSGAALCICLALSLIFNLAVIIVSTLHNSCPKTAKVKAAVDAPRNVLEPDGIVSNCITGNILGKVSPNLRSSSIHDAKITGVDKNDERRQYFKELFDIKVLYGNESDYSGPISSGKQNYYSQLLWTNMADGNKK